MRCKTVIALGLAVVLGMGSISGCDRADSGVLKLNLATPDPDDSSITIAARKYAEIIEEKSNGTIKVNVYSNGSLYGGDTAAGIKLLRSGGLDMLTLTSAAYSSFEPSFTVISIPYLFEDGEQYRDYLNSDIGEDLLAATDRLKIEGLGFWTRSFRQITNSKKEINEPADLKGIKMRVLNNPLWVEFFSQCGAITTPMSFGEVYNALQLNTIDGQENPVDIPLTSKFYEVQQYLSLTNHIADAWIVGMNQKKFDSLTDEQRRIITEATEELQKWKWEYDLVEDERAVDNLVEKGMKVNEVSAENQAKFKEISDSLTGRYQELIQNDDIYRRTMEFIGQ